MLARSVVEICRGNPPIPLRPRLTCGLLKEPGVRFRIEPVYQRTVAELFDDPTS